jgi:hypothetical protein
VLVNQGRKVVFFRDLSLQFYKIVWKILLHQSPDSKSFTNQQDVQSASRGIAGCVDSGASVALFQIKYTFKMTIINLKKGNINKFLDNTFVI